MEKQSRNMNAVKALNSACINREYKSFKDLAHGNYFVKRFQMLRTQHGDRIRIDLDGCYMYLPERFAGYLSEEAINELNSVQVVMRYSGKDPNNCNRLILNFKAFDSQEDSIDSTVPTAW